MSEVKWIKITTNMFEDEKIDFIESLPEADAILVIWVKLLTQAGKCNSNGYIFLTENIPYDENMLAHKFKKPVNTIKLALSTLERLGMIQLDEKGYISITNWEKHQNIEGLEKIREQTRKRVAKYREKQKELPSGNVTDNVTVTEGNETDIEEDKERDIDIDKEEEREGDKTPPVPYEKIKNLFNEICKSYSSIRSLSSKRKEHIRARWKQYNYQLEVFEELFNNAESSNFLKGQNKRNWKANFDWLINDNNMAKVLEGRYKNEEGEGNGEYAGATRTENQGSEGKVDLSHIGFKGTGEIDDSDLI
ncbi:phage replisome organizer N-terminal domain-containing protein [Tissierella pigra]|uniref:phage replisome organizer N-terminal domain-containing protein n=1 Tax=Tissierella pigra TaxID=2607614 RepID=UPI001C124D77|nr:phage replisome organizer N-terminal domain-containing protein [Tissierella pigra]MBU5424977.1 phage replisome organizer N-terminal domain-containing protein [Tissierella pigra]